MNYQIKKVIKDLSGKLKIKKYSDDHIIQIIWWLIEHITQQSKLDFITSDKKISLEDIEKLYFLIDRHIDNDYPLQYLLEVVSFLNLQLNVKPPVLIPRPETEAWVNNLIEQMQILKNEKLSILDMCTGSGCIGLSFAKAFVFSNIVLVDIADHALDLARENMIKNDLLNVSIIKSDVYSNLDSMKFDIIISNPPYITPQEWQLLDPVVRNWEDKNALQADDQGLAIIDMIIKKALFYLKPISKLNGCLLPRLVIEIGSLQGDVVKKMCLDAGFDKVCVMKDFSDLDRIVVCYKF